MIYSTQQLRDLKSLIETIKSKTFAIETQYKFLKLYKAVKEEWDIVDEQNIFLLQNYAELNEQGMPIVLQDGGIKIKQDCIKECSDKINEINNRQIQLPDIYFSLDELEPLGLTLGELELLEPFIK